MRSSSSRPRTRPEITFVRIGPDALAYEPASGVVHRLNATGVVVWELCTGARSTEEIVAEVAAAFATLAVDVDGSVREVIAGFSMAGLLEGCTPAAQGLQVADRRRRIDAPTPRRPDPLSSSTRLLGPYQALDLGVMVQCDVGDSSVADDLEEILLPLRAPPEALPSPESITIVVWNDDGDWVIDLGEQRNRALNASVVADFVMWHINWRAFEHSPRYLVIHGSAVARDGQALVLPATANSGKSTLATALIAAGFDYLTDEATAIDLNTGEVIGYPKPLTLDPGSQKLFPHLDPGRNSGIASKWYVAPDAIRAASVTERARLAHLVFPTYVAGADNALKPMETINATEALISHAFNLQEHGHRLGDIAELVQRCTRHSLRHDGIRRPVAAIETLPWPR